MARRTDLASELVASQPRPVRWLIALSTGLTKLMRVFFALQAIAGAVRIVAGVATRESLVVVTGLGQVLLGGLVLAMNSGSAETVGEVSGASGDFVVRTSKRREWRDARGWRKAVRFVWGGHTWRTVVRRRADDPFGRVVWHQDAETQRGAIETAKQIETRVREGASFGNSASADMPSAMWPRWRGRLGHNGDT